MDAGFRSRRYYGRGGGERGSAFLVPEVGVEPTHPCGRGILSPLRLPFRHSGRVGRTESEILEARRTSVNEPSIRDSRDGPEGPRVDEKAPPVYKYSA